WSLTLNTRCTGNILTMSRKCQRNEILYRQRAGAKNVMVVMKSKIFDALGVRVDPTTHRQWFLSPLRPLMTQSGHKRGFPGKGLSRYDAESSASGAIMRRRDFITLVGAIATWPLAARAQQPAMPVVGLLDPRSPDALANRLRAFQRGLKEAGYIERENVAIEYRWAENQMDRLPALAAELARLRVGVIISPGGLASTL